VPAGGVEQRLTAVVPRSASLLLGTCSLRTQLTRNTHTQQGSWGPALDLAKVLIAVRQLLAEPNPADPLEVAIVSDWLLLLGQGPAVSGCVAVGTRSGRAHTAAACLHCTRRRSAPASRSCSSSRRGSTSRGTRGRTPTQRQRQQEGGSSAALRWKGSSQSPRQRQRQQLVMDTSSSNTSRSRRSSRTASDNCWSREPRATPAWRPGVELDGGSCHLAGPTAADVHCGG
jgi:hypothetical protein